MSGGSLPGGEHPAPALPPPAPPPGLGERLAVSSRTWAAFWREALKALLVISVIAAAGTLLQVRETAGHPWRSGFAFAAVFVLATWLVLLYVTPPLSIAAGDGWLAVRRWRRVRWVRTDRLAEVKVLTPRTMRLKDRDGHKLRLSLGDLRSNAKLFEVFTQGLRHSVETGMKPMDRTTLGFLQLK